MGQVWDQDRAMGQGSGQVMGLERDPVRVLERVLEKDLVRGLGKE